MGFQPAPGIWQVEMRYSQDDQPCENVYHVLSTGAMDLAEAGALYDVFTGWEESEGNQERTNDVSLNSLRIVDLSTDSGVEKISSAGLPIDGTAGSSPLPNSVTIAIKANTGLVGRSHRGRSYWVGLDKSAVTGNNIKTDVATAIVGRMNDLLAAVNGGGPWTMVVLSRRHNGAPRAHGVGTAITEYSLTDFVTDTQRRRLPLHNRHH